MLKQIITAISVLAMPLAAFANEEAEEVIAGAAEELRRGQFDEIALAETFDIRRIARFTLGRYARQFDANELAHFEAAFEDFIVDRFAQEEHRFEGAEIRVEGSIDRNERDTIVETKVMMPGEDPLDVRWRVIHTGDDWKVVDVEVVGLWLAIEQRAQISAVLGQSGATLKDAVQALGQPG